MKTITATRINPRKWVMVALALAFAFYALSEQVDRLISHSGFKSTGIARVILFLTLGFLIHQRVSRKKEQRGSLDNGETVD